MTTTPRISALSDHDLPEAARPTTDQVKKALGMLPNLHRTVAHSPAALKAYTGSVAALAGGQLSPGLRESLALGIAGKNRCDYCASAHTMIGKAAGLNAQELNANLRLESADTRTQAALQFASEVLEHRGHVPDTALQKVRAAGLRDGEIIEIIAHVSLNVFTNFVNSVARTDVDFPRVNLAAAH